MKSLLLPTLLSTLISGTALSLLAGCGNAPAPNSSPIACNSQTPGSFSASHAPGASGSPCEAPPSPPAGKDSKADASVVPNRLTLVDEAERPLAGLAVRYQVSPYSEKANALRPAQTDAGGNLTHSCSDLCLAEVEADGYWGYDGPFTDPGRIQLAALSPEERTGKALSFAGHELFRLRGQRLSQDKNIRDFAELFSTDQTTRESSFQVRSEAELQSVLAAFGRMDAEAMGLVRTGSEPFDALALMRATHAAGKRLVGYSNNHFFRYGEQLHALHETEASYYFSQNRSGLLSGRGMSGHSYDYELIVYALPDDGKSIVFHTGAGKLTLKP